MATQLCTMEGWAEIKGEVQVRRAGKWSSSIFEMKARVIVYMPEYKEWWSGYIVNPGKGNFIFRPDMRHCPY